MLQITSCALAHPLLDPSYSADYQPASAPELPTTLESDPHREEGEVISVRITSSVAVDRGSRRHHTGGRASQPHLQHTSVADTHLTSLATATEPTGYTVARLPQPLEGANIEFIKQLNAKKEARGFQNVERTHPFQVTSVKPPDSGDSAIEESVKSILEIPLNNNEDLYNEVPLARSVLPGSPTNFVLTQPQKSLHERRNSPRLTTVSFNVVHHSTPIVTPNYNDRVNTYTGDQTKSFSTPEHFYSEPPKVYSEPAKVYSEPAKIYSEPAKIYSEPAKVYSEPAKVYGEPAKIYSEPAKFYSQPASLHLELNGPPAPRDTTVIPEPSTSTTSAPAELNATSTESLHHHHQPERNYEVDEKISVSTDGRSHGVQDGGNPEDCRQDKCKVGYVVEGRQYRKYRVEERTADGYIVGEYGVVRNEDGALRGVRYTADGDASPRLIYDALMKFLQLK